MDCCINLRGDDSNPAATETVAETVPDVTANVITSPSPPSLPPTPPLLASKKSLVPKMTSNEFKNNINQMFKVY